MEEMRVLVAEGDRAARLALVESLMGRNFSVDWTDDGRKVMEMILERMPDAVVLSMALPGCDGLSVIERLSAVGSSCYPYVIVATRMGDQIMRRALALGADAAFEKPLDIARFEETLLEMQKAGPSKIALAHADARVMLAKEQLHEIGMSGSLKGFAYLARAVSLISVDPRILRQATRVMYPLIAREAGVTDHSVERAIRHAIEAAWTHGNVEALHRFFGNSIDPQRGKPTNTECIAMLSEQLKERIAGEQLIRLIK